MRTLSGIVAALALVAGVEAAPADAAVGVGQTFAPTSGCLGPLTGIQSASPGSSYAIPSPGVISSWSYQANSMGAPNLQLKIMRRTGGDDFRTAGQSAVESFPVNQTTVFATRISVSAGDLLGVFFPAGSSGGCAQSAAGFATHSLMSDVPPGSTATFDGPSPGVQIDVSAVLEPDADGDGFGDESQDCAAANPSQNVDCVSPETQITKGPKDKTKKKQASFEFSSSEPASTFECSLDGGPFAPCTSPDTLKVKKGKHHFEVRAKDASGNVDASPPTDDWKVKRKKQ